MLILTDHKMKYKTILTKKQANRAYKTLTEAIMKREGFKQGKGYCNTIKGYPQAVNRLLESCGLNKI